MSCGVDCRRSSDPALLWLWHWLVAAALISSLAWEPPYAVGAALEKTKKTKKKNYNEISPYTRPSSKRLQTVNAGEGEEKRESPYNVGGNVNWCSHYGKQYSSPSKN